MLISILKFGSLGFVVVLVGLASLWLDSVGKTWWFAPIVVMIGTIAVLSALLLGKRDAAFQTAATATWKFLFQNPSRASATLLVLVVAVVLVGWQTWRMRPDSTNYFSVMVYRELRLTGHFAVGATVIVHTETDGATYTETVRENGVARFDEITVPTIVQLQINELRGNSLWQWAPDRFPLTSLPDPRDYDISTVPKWTRIGLAPSEPPNLAVSRPARERPSEKEIGDPNLQKINAPWGVPDAPTLINRYAYILGVDTSRRIPLWAAYAVAVSERDTGPRPNFVHDPAIPKEMQSTTKDFRGSGFDRGHLVSPADVRFKGRVAVVEANYQTTLTPQVPRLNRFVWFHLERATRSLAEHLGHQVFVLVGPLFSEAEPVQTIGQNKIPVPTHFFRVTAWISTEGKLNVASYLLSNDAARGQDFQDFAVPIEKIEEMSGLTILPDLDPAIAKAVKARVRRLPST